MRKLVADTVHNQHLRMAGLPAEQRTDELIHTITLQDVDEFTMDEVTPQKTSIGFKMSGGSNEQQTPIIAPYQRFYNLFALH